MSLQNLYRSRLTLLSWNSPILMRFADRLRLKSSKLWTTSLDFGRSVEFEWSVLQGPKTFEAKKLPIDVTAVNTFLFGFEAEYCALGPLARDDQFCNAGVRNNK